MCTNAHGRRRISAPAIAAAALLLMQAASWAAIVAYWPFDGNANDISGNNNNATLAGGATYAAGYYGQALSLNGSSAYAWAPDSPSLRIGPYTVSVWVRPELNDEYWTGIVGKPGRNYNIWLGESNDPNGGFIHHRWHDGAGTNSGASDAHNVPMNTWTHIAIVNDGTVGRTYINGVQQGQGNVTGSLIIDNTPIQFGRSLDGGNGQWFQGRIDDVAIWNQALPPATIQALANGTARPADWLNVPRARLVSSPTALVMGAAYAENLGTGQIIGPVNWQIHKMDVTTASAIAYVVPSGQAGNQQHTGALGMDFNVNQPITITQLGAFDDGSNGLSRTISVRLYDRTAPASPLATLTFSPGDPGTLIGGSRFKPLPTPLNLPVGFQGCIVADGYGPGEQNGNSGGAVPPWTTDSGGGAISFVGTARWHASAGVYPTNLDGGPANRYAAGTFMFEYSTYTVGELLAQGNYNVGDNLTDGFFFALGTHPGWNTLRLTVTYGDQSAEAFANIFGTPEPTTLALVGVGMAFLATRRRKGVRSMDRPKSALLALVMAFVISVAGSSQAALIAYWPLNDAPGTTAAANLVPGGPVATLRNMDPNTSWVPGRFGGALNFTAADDYLDILLNPLSSLNIPETNVTVSMWIRTTAANGGLFSINNPERGGENDRNVWVDGSGNIRARIWTWGGEETITATPPAGGSYIDGTWHHVVHQYGAAIGGQRVYVDGQLRASGTYTTSSFNWRTRAEIAWANQAPSLVGQIDDVAIWNHLLTPAQIQALANGTASPGDALNVPRARLVSSPTALVMGAAYAENLGSGQIIGPVNWQIHKMDVTTASAIAYVIPFGQAGNQQHTGALGMEFNVNQPITITQLGAFDDGSNGLNRTISVRLYDRTAPASPLATLTFSPGDPGTLIGGSRFKPLPTPLNLPVGFQGCIVADGYGPGEQNGNSWGAVPPWTTDSGGGAISFVGTARWDGAPGVYPNNIDGGPANRYAAGTFMFEYSTYTVGELLAQGNYNVGDNLTDGFFFALGTHPGWNTLRLTVTYGDQSAEAFANIFGTPEPGTCLLLAGGLAALARRRRKQARP